MGKLVTPSVYFIGYTTINGPELERYLKDSGNEEFLETIKEARKQGLSDGEILTSFYAKLCYASLTLGHNDNITRIRDIPDNLRSTWDSGHGSVWEHCLLNFVARDCSRVYEAEQIRHRVGVAYSILSGRYVRGEVIDLVFDPILENVKGDVLELQDYIEETYNKLVDKIGLRDMTNFDEKKRITSALRRILPEGKAKEVGFSINLRALRHIIQLRTSGGAEWEIREIYAQVYGLIKDKYPLLFYGAKEEVVRGLVEVSGMKTQPYAN